MNPPNFPTNNEKPYYCENVSGDIQAGSFVHFVDEQMKIQVGQVLATGRVMILHLFAPIKETQLPGLYHPIVEGFGAGIPKLVRMNTTVFVHHCKIVEVAFVFSESELEYNSIVMHGISIAYVCRFNEMFQAIQTVSFPPAFPRSLGQILFTDLERVRDIIVGVLHRGSEHGEIVRILKHSSCSDYFWMFIKRQFGNTVESKIMRKIKHQIRTSPDMTRSKARMLTQEELIRLENQVQFEKFKDIFGTNMTFGVRARCPRVTNPPEPIDLHETINHIHQRDGNEANEFQPIPPARNGGLDFIYNLTTGDFSLRVRYIKVDLDDGGVDQLDYDDNESTDLSDDVIGLAISESQEDIFLGEIFDSADGETTYRVVQVGAETVVGQPINSDGPNVEFNRSYASDAITLKGDGDNLNVDANEDE